jgi:phosphinothricin acetyltransferase
MSALHAAPPASDASLAISVRPVTVADAPSLHLVWNDGRGEPAPIPLLPGIDDWPMAIDDIHHWITQHKLARRPLWLATCGGEPAGLLSFIGFHDRPGGEATSELAIHMRHGWRARGIGRSLLQLAINAAPMLGFDRYVAYIRSDNVRSQRLFRGHGFNLWGRMPGVLYVGDQRHDFLVLGMELPTSIHRVRS